MYTILTLAKKIPWWLDISLVVPFRNELSSSSRQKFNSRTLGIFSVPQTNYALYDWQQKFRIGMWPEIINKNGSLNLKKIEAESKKLKKVFFFKEDKQTTWLIEKIKWTFMLYVFCFCCNESIVVDDIKNVHNVSFLFIRNSIDYYIIVKDLRRILSLYKIFTK